MPYPVIPGGYVAIGITLIAAIYYFAGLRRYEKSMRNNLQLRDNGSAGPYIDQPER
jgi:hypothetical protein